MNQHTFNTRIKNAGIKRSSQGYKIAFALMATKEKQHTCITSEKRFMPDHVFTDEAVLVLEAAGLIKGKDFFQGNDSKQGKTKGEFIELSQTGKSKSFKY